jgi:iron complex transport system ATP-binding protein
MSLVARGLTLAYGDRAVVRSLDLEIPPERITAVVGANASGKSTLLKGLARLLRPAAGTVTLDGEDVARLAPRELARRLGLLAQAPAAPDALTVAELVARGRYPHTGLLRPWSDQDRERVEWALAATGASELRDRLLDELSGGQRQRAWIAMALAQDTGLLLLDEPTTYLDMAHQIEVLDLLAELGGAGRTIVMVLHDLNHACRYADHLVALRDGEVYAAGAPVEIVDAELVQAVFGVRAQVLRDPASGAPHCIPLARDQPAGRERSSSQAR